jgi:hypothetical protein
LYRQEETQSFLLLSYFVVPPPLPETVTMAPYLSSILVFLLPMWQVLDIGESCGHKSQDSNKTCHSSFSFFHGIVIDAYSIPGKGLKNYKLFYTSCRIFKVI